MVSHDDDDARVWPRGPALILDTDFLGFEQAAHGGFEVCFS
jgi:hypothetical protein